MKPLGSTLDRVILNRVLPRGSERHTVTKAKAASHLTRKKYFVTNTAFVNVLETIGVGCPESA